jgi:hypothetical protein
VISARPMRYPAAWLLLACALCCHASPQALEELLK